MNVLGHDSDSELLTLIKRLREKHFSILNYNINNILFELELRYNITVPVPHTSYQHIKYFIKRNCIDNLYKYEFKQLNGDCMREIPNVDGYIIWSLLEEALDFK